MNYAIIENNIVENITISDSQLYQNWVSIPQGANVGIGYTYVNGVFTPPVASPQLKRTLTKLEYMNRFTDAELAGIYTTAKTVVAVEIWLEKFKLATEINLDDPTTIAGLQAMEGAGLLVVGRSAEILA